MKADPLILHMRMVGWHRPKLQLKWGQQVLAVNLQEMFCNLGRIQLGTNRDFKFELSPN